MAEKTEKTENETEERKDVSVTPLPGSLVQERGAPGAGRIDVNLNLAAMVERLDAEEREEPKLIEGKAE